MPISFGGMASGVDTEEIIKKLVQVESRPIIQWEEEKKTASLKKQALGKLKDHITALQDAAKELYGFRAAYFDKSVNSSDTSIIDATASRHAEKGSSTIVVKELAGVHKISSEEIKKDRELEAGKFTIQVNGEKHTIRFRGGKISSLFDIITEEASDIIASNLMNTRDDMYTLTLESKTPGTKGEILLSGDKGILSAIGLIKGEKGAEPSRTDMVFDQKYFIPYAGPEKTVEQNGSLSVSKDGKSVRVTGSLWREYVLPLEVPIKEDSTFEFEFTYKEPPAEKEDEIPFRVELGPEERTVIKGIELHGYNVPRIRELEKKKKKEIVDNILGVGVVSQVNGERKEKIYQVDKKSKGKQEIPIGRDFKDKKATKIILYCNEGEADFLHAAILTPEKGTGFFDPRHVITKAKNARMIVDGVEVIRDKNSGINDVIKGVTINLKRASEHPVTLTIESNTKNAVEKIKKFIEAYNAYIEYSAELTMVERTKSAGPGGKQTVRTGLFVGDSTIIRLENTVKTTVSAAYPSKAENPIKIITQLGISTGAINADWETIKTGKLLFDEEKFTNVVQENPDGVKEFFGSDTDGDTRIDNGMAYKLQQALKPYTMTGKNIIQAKIDYENNAIKSSDERIARHQEHIVQYEDKLRRKFAAMEKAISGSKAQSSWLKQNMGGGKEEK